MSGAGLAGNPHIHTRIYTAPSHGCPVFAPPPFTPVPPHDPRLMLLRAHGHSPPADIHARALFVQGMSTSSSTKATGSWLAVIARQHPTHKVPRRSTLIVVPSDVFIVFARSHNRCSPSRPGATGHRSLRTRERLQTRIGTRASTERLPPRPKRDVTASHLHNGSCGDVRLSALLSLRQPS